MRHHPFTEQYIGLYIFYDFAEPLDSRILFSTGTHGFPCCDMHAIAEQSNNLLSKAKLLLTAEKQVSRAKSRKSSRHGFIWGTAVA